MDHFDSERDKLLANISLAEQKVKERSQTVKELVDLQESDILQELQSLKSDAVKEAESHKGRLWLAVTEMESFVTSSLELKSKSDAPSFLTQAVRDMSVRAKQLLGTHAIPDEFRIPTYEFTPVDIDVDQNYIGHVSTAEESGTNSGIFRPYTVFNVSLSGPWPDLVDETRRFAVCNTVRLRAKLFVKSGTCPLRHSRPVVPAPLFVCFIGDC